MHMSVQLKTPAATHSSPLPAHPMARSEPKHEPYVSGIARAGRLARLLEQKADKKR